MRTLQKPKLIVLNRAVPQKEKSSTRELASRRNMESAVRDKEKRSLFHHLIIHFPISIQDPLCIKVCIQEVNADLACNPVHSVSYRCQCSCPSCRIKEERCECDSHPVKVVMEKEFSWGKMPGRDRAACTCSRRAPGRPLKGSRGKGDRPRHSWG